MLGQIIAPVGTEEYPPRKRFPIVTAAIVVLNIIVFFFEISILLTRGEDALDIFFKSNVVILWHLFYHYQGVSRIVHSLLVYHAALHRGSLLGGGYSTDRGRGILGAYWRICNRSCTHVHLQKDVGATGYYMTRSNLKYSVISTQF